MCGRYFYMDVKRGQHTLEIGQIAIVWNVGISEDDENIPEG